MSEDNHYSFVVGDVSCSVDEEEVRRELMTRYRGVGQVKRMFFDGKDGTPMNCIEVSFTSKEEATNIFNSRRIVIGGIVRQVFVMEKCEHRPTSARSNLVLEHDLTNVFEAQKK